MILDVKQVKPAPKYTTQRIPQNNDKNIFVVKIF